MSKIARPSRATTAQKKKPSGRAGTKKSAVPRPDVKTKMSDPSGIKRPVVTRPGVVEILEVLGAWERREKAIIAQMAEELRAKPPR